MDADNKNYEGIKVKEEVEDASYHDINQDSIEGALNTIFIKQECKLEVNLDCAEDEHLAYNENLKNWTSTNVNSTKNSYEEQLFQCPECSVKTKYEDNLNKHISFMHPKNKTQSNSRVQNKNRNIQNNFALQRAGNKNDLLLGKENSLDNQNCISSYKHKLLKKKKFLFNCSGCSFKSNLKIDFIFHVYQCQYNNDDIKHSGILRTDNNNSSQSEMFECPYCKKHYQAHQKLKKHLTYCTYPCTVQCDYCSIDIKGKYNLKRHIFNKHFEGGIFKKIKKDDLNYQPILKLCPKCGRRYQHTTNLLKHVANCGKKDLFQCSTCSFTTNYDYSLAAHILLHLHKRNLCLDLIYGHTRNVL